MTEGLQWRTAQGRSGPVAVQVAFDGDTVYLRDADDPRQRILRFTREEWEAFVAGVEHGEFVFR